MRKKLMAVAVLALCMLTLIASIALADYDPIIVRVGQYAYPRSIVMTALQNSIAVYEATTGYEVNAEDIAQLKSEVVSTFVSQGVLENKLHDLGLDKLTTEDENALTQQAMEMLEEYKAEYAKAIVAQYGCDEAKALRYAPVFMDLDGVAVDQLRDQANAKLKQKRITEFVCKNVPRLTEEEVGAWYEENYVKPCRERYGTDLYAFESEIVIGGGQSFWIPGGYRYVQTILFAADDALKEEAYVLRQQLVEAQKEAERLDNALYGYQLLGEDDTQAQTELDAQLALIEGIKAQIAEKYAQMAEPYAEKMEKLKSRLEAGEDFMTLRGEYDKNPEPQEEGYLVCAGSVVWEDAFRDAAMSLEKPGDWVGPILTGGGAQFLCYAGDAPEGAYPMELAGAENITKAAQDDADNRLLMSNAKLWQKDYEVETHPELLMIQ